MADWIITHYNWLLVALFGGAWLASASFFILEAGGRAIVVRFAIVRRWVKPGFIWQVPILDRVVRLPERRYAPDYPERVQGHVVSAAGASGLVRLDGELWMWPAVPDGGNLKKGARIRVVRREGDVLSCEETK